MADEGSYQVAWCMDLAMNPVPGKSAVDDFIVQAVTQTSPARLLIVNAKTDVCVTYTNGYLQVQEDMRHLDVMGPAPQLITRAIAAVQPNKRTRDLPSVDPLVVKVIAGTTMTGTSPTCYKIPATLELIEVVQRGE
ncbi:hypothetical protein V8E53_003810 [Lactarius tabidus]